jgi:hypothetical protein
LRRIPLGLLLIFFLASPAGASVFGDGDASNGEEDGRIVLASPEWAEQAPAAWSRSAGSVHCDGRNRGTAMILETSGLGPQPSGLVLVTAAHVLFDLERAEPFARCDFHYMGLDQLPGYQAEIELATAMRGGFDARQPRESAAFGRGDWAFVHVPGPIPGVAPDASIKPLPFAAIEVGAAATFSMVGYSPRHAAISISLDCTVVESSPADLGGGAWPGQLLDDCDSGQGASGGGLIASFGREHFLVGIRTGAHWDSQLYPAQDFPKGPPAGAPWDIQANTNFCRAIDQGLLTNLSEFLRRLEALRAIGT